LATLKGPFVPAVRKGHLFSYLQGAAEQGLEKIPGPIKEATALFYGERGLAHIHPGSEAWGEQA
jgi:hypothetical protein